MNTSDPKLNPAKFAREVLDYYLEKGSLPELPEPLPPEYDTKAGAFVSLKKEGRLRGCIGTFEPVRDNLAEEIATNAISAAVRDPRFPPVERDELPGLDISVDVLSPLERVENEKELDHKNYGVMVCSGPRRGLLLPDLEGVDSVEEQLDIARRKAGIEPGEKIEIYRFKVTRYEEDQ
ncbi:MAG: AmmeMemoRadiSam system protein A [Bacillota bacterium]